MRTIIVDTREKIDKNLHVTSYFEQQGYKTLRSKLPFGDYTFVDNMSVIVDRKATMSEICSNVTREHKRFCNELELAKENGIQLYILIEDEYITKLDEVNRWFNPMRFKNSKATSGTTLFKILYSIEKNYNTKFYFTTHRDCGESIIKILEGKMNEPRGSHKTI